MRALSALGLRGRLLAAFLACAGLAAVSGGVGILSLTEIRDKTRATGSVIGQLIDEQRAQSTHFATVRGLVTLINDAESAATLSDASKQLEHLAGPDDPIENVRVQQHLVQLLAEKQEALSAAAESATLRQDSNRLLEDITHVAGAMADQAESRALASISETLNTIQSVTAKAQETLAGDLTTLSEQTGKAMSAVKAALDTRSRCQELNIQVNDALLARDAAAVDYARITVATLFKNARAGLADLPPDEATAGISSTFDRLSAATDAMLEARKQMLTAAESEREAAARRQEQVSATFHETLAEITTQILEVVDAVEFDSTIAVEDGLEQIRTRTTESQENTIEQVRVLSASTNQGISTVKSALALRASCYQLTARLQDALLATDANVVEQDRTALSVLFAEAQKELDSLGGTDTTGGGEELMALSRTIDSTLDAQVRLLGAKAGLNSTSEEVARQMSALDQMALTRAEDVKSEVALTMQETDNLVSRWQRWQLLLGVGAVASALTVGSWISRSITRRLRRTIAGLSDGSENANRAADRISSAATELAAGGAEQAASLQESSVALDEMAKMTHANAESAREADKISSQTRTAAQDCDQTMNAFDEAMSDINESSMEISKIIKVIEEIAFQTNLLALNAAVEAARAGEHGKGFAVVADEVRNLAQRAATAAQETTALIDDSIDRVRQGTEVATKVGSALTGIVGDVSRVSDLIARIAHASEDQAQGVDRINASVSQIDEVTQRNSAGAEESALAAGEMAGQAQALRTMVGELGAMVNGCRSGTLAQDHPQNVSADESDTGPASRSASPGQATAPKCTTVSNAASTVGSVDVSTATSGDGDDVSEF